VPQFPSGLAKYVYKDASERSLHQGQIVGRSPSNGLPVRGNGRAPDMIGDQADDLPIVSDYYARMFCLWDEEDVQAYVTIMDHAANGQYVIMDRVKIPVEKDPSGQHGGHLKVWLEWSQVYVQAEPTQRPITFGGP
jgi:hypothetical protein